MKIEESSRIVKDYGDVEFVESCVVLKCRCGWWLELKSWGVSTVQELRREMLHRLSCSAAAEDT